MTEPVSAVRAAPVTLEMTGMSCPIPLLSAKRLLDDLPDGLTLVLISDCPGTAGDLSAWAGVTGYEITDTQPLDGRRVAYSIRRRPDGRSHAGNVVLDMRGATCPGPIIEAKRLLDGMRRGEVLVLVSNCPSAPSEVASWTASTAIELIDVYESSRGVREFYLRRTPAERSSDALPT